MFRQNHFLLNLQEKTSMQPNRLVQRRNRMVRFWIIPLLLFILFNSFCSNILAQSDSTMNARIRFLQKSILNDQQGTKKWWYGWLAGYGTATVGQVTVSLLSNQKAVRQDMAVGAVTTLLGFSGQFISVFQPVNFAAKFEKISYENPQQQHDMLIQMEKFLVDRVLLEQEARKWKAHILCTGVNLASGLVTWIGFHRTVWDGVVNFGLNCVISEAQIWSQPMRAKRALKRYHDQFGSDNASYYQHPEITCNFIVSTNGAGFQITF